MGNKKVLAGIGLLLVAVAMAWYSNRVEQGDVRLDDQVDAGLRQKISRLDQELFAAIRADRQEEIAGQISPQLQLMLDGADHPFRPFRTIMDHGEPVGLHVYDYTGPTRQLASGTNKTWTMLLPPVGFERFIISLYTLPLKNKQGIAVQDYLIGIIRGGKGWPIITMNTGVFRLLGADHDDWMGRAMQEYTGDPLMQSLSLTLAGQLRRPFEWFAFQESDAHTELRERFADLVSKAEGEYQAGAGQTARVFKVAPFILGGSSRVFPEISWVTQIPVDQRDAIDAGAAALRRSLEERSPLFRNYSGSLVFKAFNELPSDEGGSYPVRRSLVRSAH